MDKLKENVDYSTEGLVKAINQLIDKIKKLSEAILEIAEKDNHRIIRSKARRINKM